jgi:hypothetical protein
MIDKKRLALATEGMFSGSSDLHHELLREKAAFAPPPPAGV